MLLAIDIDGTIAADGQWHARWLAHESGLAIPEDELAHIQYGFQFWELPQVQAMHEEARQRLKKLAKAHHKDADQHANAIPVPGARDALQRLSQHAGIIYTTCRYGQHRRLTSAWLRQYGFPCPESVHCCERYHHKFLAARNVAEPRESIVLIDDLAERMVRAFRALALADRAQVVDMITRLTIVAIGETEPPTFPFKVPFPVLALPSWKIEDIERLGKEAITSQAIV